MIHYGLKANKITLVTLDKLFNLSDYDDFDSIINGSSDYKTILNTQYNSMFIDDDNLRVYLIFLPQKIHLILRKFGDHESYKSKLVTYLGIE